MSHPYILSIPNDVRVSKIFDKLVSVFVMKVIDKNNIKKKVDSLFSRPFFSYEAGDVERHLIFGLRNIILPEKDRAKVVLKSSFCSFYDNFGNVKYNCLHPARFVANRIMNIIKNSDMQLSLKWINSIQENSMYRMELLKACRQSNIFPRDNWHSRQQSIWSLSNDKSWKISNVVVIMPSFNDSVSYINMDSFRSNTGFEYNHSFKRANSFLKNDFKLYPFAFMLNLDKICSCIMEMDNE